MHLNNFVIVILLFTEALGNCQNNVSILKNHIDRVFTRRKRHLVFPLYGAMKITVAMGKSIIIKYPKGLNLSIEVSTYYPFPTQLEEWYPKWLRKKTTPKPAVNDTIVYIPGFPYRFKAKPPTIKPPINRIDKGPIQWIDTSPTKNYDRYNQYQSSTNELKWKNFENKWKTNRPKNKYYTEPNNKWLNNQKSNKFSWKTISSDAYNRERYQSYNNHNSRYNWTSSIDAGNNAGNYRRFSSGTTSRRPIEKSHNLKYQYHYPKPLLPLSSYSSTILSPSSQSSSSFGYNWRTANDNSKSKMIPEDIFIHRPHKFDDLQPYEDWKYIRGHRDRRDIYHHFEGFSSIFNFDMKSCIMRSICESKRVLLPPGYSLIQDIIRIVFSLPTLDGMLDEYSQAMRGDYGDCHKAFKKNCPFSILDFIINTPIDK